ncbi:acyl-CoA N-acyltransferase [Sporormia fimetaria CBS 119925]|uniref:Histone acetyltransferase type B catalytic subunit n=1 Tax=Sporormia fimetaria CBS 119925 TaxID=1340428 RepID=A0A6A6VL67_9PLEO|nr:acyl-CoA N-acyltransferase [Sporormia fimetaria CBS 119925]
MESAIAEFLPEAKNCIHIYFNRPSASDDGQPVPIAGPLQPEFTYQLFGENETILGYRDPNIRLDFIGGDMRPRVQIQYEEKVDLSTIPKFSEQQVDLDEAFREHLPEAAFSTTENGKPSPDMSTWKPPGTMIKDFKANGKSYEVWSASLADAAALQLWQNVQILVLFYVDGASPLELDEDWTYKRWTLHLLYEVTPSDGSASSSYILNGLATSHRYWLPPTTNVMRWARSLPSPPTSTNGASSPQRLPKLERADNDDSRIFKETVELLEQPCRERVSQFLIFPPYQGESLGTRMYQTLFDHYWKQPNVYEIPVEDPNEDFDVMRDYADVQYLRTVPEFSQLSIASTLAPEKLRKQCPIPREDILGNGVDLEALRHKCKIAPRQFNRLVEIHLLSTIPPHHRSRARISRKDKSNSENDRKYYFWRLALKARVYSQNADVLDQLSDDPEARVEQIEATVDRVQIEYEERLEGLKKRIAVAAEEQNGTLSRGTKRTRVIVESEDESSDDASKKQKL